MEYTGPLARTQRAKQLESTVTFLQLLQTVAQSDPSILGILKKENLIATMVDLLGVPYWVLKTQEELQGEQTQAQRQQFIDTLLQAGPALGQTVKNTSEGIQNLAQTAQVGLEGQGNIKTG